MTTTLYLPVSTPGPEPAHVRQVEPVGIAHDHPLHVAAPIQKQSQLASQFPRKLTKGSGQLWTDQLPGPHPALVQVFKTLELTGFETQGIAKDFMDKKSSLPLFRTP